MVQETLSLPRTKDPALIALFIELQRQWRQMAAVVNIQYYEQDAEPTISTNSSALWKDTNAGPKYYLVANFGGTQKKVELI